jgi:ribulose-5-phosphate 4-epimerase/fuculose-1-phosphate aldolase
MRVGRVPVVDYTRPGSPAIKPLIAALAAEHPAVLLQNHGPVVAGPSLDAAVFAIEELEEAARLAIITRGMAVRMLDVEAIADLNLHFKLK